jgi:actin-related protein
MLFEEFDVPYVAIANSASMAMLTYGETSGTVVDFGHENVLVCPVLQGDVVRYAVSSSAIGGRALGEAFANAMRSLQGGTASWEDAGKYIHQYAVVADDFDKYGKRPFTSAPVLGRLAYEIPEYSYFRTGPIASKRVSSAIGMEELASASVPELILQSSLRLTTNDDTVNALSKIVVCGGGSKIAGMQERICSDLVALSPKAAHATLPSVPDHLPVFDSSLASYLGACILSSTDHFKDIGINKAQYDEEGPSAIRRMAF